ncbi:MAG: GNAT family N-acetyltransferase [Cardiobacteriaceae bacterium]|nr:GNAT family N-acetyltransferase [Cardiobacteriaceae bacterium]
MKSKVSFRLAEPADSGLILDFVRQLAKYERLEHEVVATPERLADWLFEKKAAEVVFALLDGKEVGFALFFHNFSTFLGRGGLYLEDVFVLEEYRGRGVGKALLRYLAQVARERDCGRFEWSCLDWNQPSIDFYRSLGAVPQEEWTVFRLTGEALEKLATGE